MPAIKKPSDHFNPVVYSGANPASQTVTVGFQPDFVWIKSRTQTYGNYVFDVVRTPTFGLITNSTDGDSTGDALTFTSTGFTTTASAGATNDPTGAPNNFASWNWKAGGAAVTNTAGTITSQVSANPTAGFSIVAWAGNSSAAATVGHGLGAVPAMIICKERNGGDYWHIKHKSMATTVNGFFNTNVFYSAATVGDGVLGDLNSNTTFGFATAGSPGNVVAVNETGKNNIAYCWSEIEGYSKFGSYVGNNSADGPFVYCGFRPAFVLIKNTTQANWTIVDNKRDTSNVATKRLFPSNGNVEATATNNVDMLSNGFKLRVAPVTDVGANEDGVTFIYAAFAESPFKFSNAR
jgi:hypothetical protein